MCLIDLGEYPTPDTILPKTKGQGQSTVSILKSYFRPVWGSMPLIPAPGKKRQVDLSETKVTLANTASSRSTGTTERPHLKK